MTIEAIYTGELSPCRGGFLQFDVQLGDLEANLSALRRGLAALNPAGPGLLVLPELWGAGFDYPNMAQHCSRTPELLGALQAEADRYNILLAGSLPEHGDDPEGYRRIFNTLFIVGPTGVLGQIRKQQLFAPMDEDRHFTAGDNPQPVATSLGLVAGQVCFDLRFPDLSRSQAAQGAQLMVVSGQWPAARREHWRVLLKARAIENQMFVIGCNRCGETGDTEFGGHSLIVAPDGTVLAEAGAGEEAKLVALDPALVAKSRRLFTVVAHSPYRYPDRDKIVTLDELLASRAVYRRLGRRLVYTNGCFDILHRGHVTYLEAARRLGDCLVVGLNSDASVRRLKGPSRPLNDEDSRARVLAALGCVDFVVLFEEDTPQELIGALLPEVLVKGGDWPVAKIVGAPEVLAAGGEVYSIPLVENFSTTGLIARIAGQGEG
ncbi:MAG: D-glycero-beta-D-manno-heptose 1-phosphate adenylyltransferase [Proteobacteria bacterium]|nr:D-glycero-beta-D-manno-heptose 1-phosphate adenylyltransferase [Pseudomonadota bacterium]